MPADDAVDYHPLHLSAEVVAPATGLLVTYVADGSQAADLGILPGMVITHCADQTVSDQASLAALISAVGDASATLIVAAQPSVSGPNRMTMTGGTLGVAGLPAVAGETVALLPPASGVTFDVSVLLAKPRVLFERFLLEGRHAGYGQTALIPNPDQPGSFMLASEYAFDGGEDWGPQHYVVRQEYLLTATGPQAQRGSVLTPHAGGWTSWQRSAADNETIHITTNDDNGLPTTTDANMPLDGIPSYLATQLVVWLPQTVGTCIHYPLVAEGDAGVLHREALVAVAEEPLTVNGTEITALRWERRSYLRVTTTIWTDPTTGTIVKAEYGGGAESQISTQDAMLVAGQADGLLAPILYFDDTAPSLAEQIAAVADQADAAVAMAAENQAAATQAAQAVMQAMCDITHMAGLCGTDQATIQAAIEPVDARIGAALALLDAHHN